MKKTWLYFVLFCVILFLVFAGWTLVRSDNSTSEVGALANELNQQRDAKQKCLDDLTYYESEQARL